MNAPAVLLATLLVTAGPQFGEKPRELPAALVRALDGARDALAKEKPKAALQALDAYDGEEDALWHLIRGDALLAMRNSKAAETSYRRALELDPDLQPAGAGLARILVDRKAWKEARSVLGRLLPDSPSADLLGLYAQVAYESEDYRLASVLTERGLIRFPGDERFRRLDLALAYRIEDWPRLERGTLGLLAERPSDPKLWTQLAAARRDAPTSAGFLAAVEAAALAKPSDVEAQLRHAGAQLAAGHYEAAWTVAARLLDGKKPPAKAYELLANAGLRLERLAETDKRLARAPASAAVDLLRVRIKLASGNDRGALKGLEAYLEKYPRPPHALLWAGSLAERLGDRNRAEAYYLQARDEGGEDARLAPLHLARLYQQRGDVERAREVLATRLREAPDDADAARLLELLPR